MSIVANIRKTGFLVSVVCLCIFASSLVRAGELKPLYPGYPEVFDLQGILQSVQQDQLVVSDATLERLSGTSFHTQKGSVGQAGIPIGTKVGLLLTEDRGVKSVWLLEAGATGADQDAAEENKAGSGGPLRLEDGVWKN